jgi:Sep-tRNA:Cys-tRNA synthetase
MHSREREELFININPLQTAGRTRAAVRKAVTRFVDGYSVCDACTGILHDIEKPPIKSLTRELAEFLNVDEARTTAGAREAKFMVMHSECRPGDILVLDGNAHYSTHVAAARAGLETAEVPAGPPPFFRITADAYAQTLADVKARTGRPAALALLTHVDGDYGNLTDAAAIAAVCREAEVPLLLNTAYTTGRMPVDVRALGADFVACSGHKSWGACGPIGVVGAVGERAAHLFRLDERFPKKNIELLGCTARGSNIMSLMEALPLVKQRIQKWEEELENARWFAARMEHIGKGGIKLLGDNPTNHDLMRFATPLFHEIGQRQRKKGYFLHKELTDRGITGLKPGQTQWFKMSTYGLSRSQVEYLAQAFEEIAAL